MRRRQLLIGAGGVAAAGVAGVALTGTAAADVNGSYEISDPETAETGDGEYNYVDKASVALFEWQYFTDPATDVTFDHKIDLDGENEHTLYEATFSLDDLAADAGGSLDWSTGSGQSGTLHVGVGDAEPLIDEEGVEPQSEDSRWPILVSHDYWDENEDDLYGVPDPLVTDVPQADDGETNETEVTITKHVEIHNENESAEVELSDTFTVVIENLDSEVDGEGEGDTSIDH